MLVSTRTRIWLGVATAFTLLNAFSAGLYAADPMHGGGHGLAALAGVYWVWWLAARAWRQRPASLPAGEERLAQLQQSVDAMAVEVERIGESARFTAKLAAEKKEQPR